MEDDGPQGVPLAGGAEGDRYAGYDRAIALEEEEEEQDERERAVARCAARSVGRSGVTGCAVAPALLPRPGHTSKMTAEIRLLGGVGASCWPGRNGAYSQGLWLAYA